MRALVTGITGQDGSYLKDLLLKESWEVHGLVRESNSANESRPRLTEHVGDLSDHDRLTSLVHEIEPDVVFNLGGMSSVAASWSQPQLTGRVTGLSAGAALEACWSLQKRTGREVRFIQASSSEIFGSPTTAPQDERAPISPLNPYGAAKAYAHNLVGVYRARGLFASSAVLYNHESPRRPDSFVTRKISRGVALIAAGAADELSLGNLDSCRDWGWAPDYVAAMYEMSRYSKAEDFVIATGVVHSVREFVEAAFKAVDIEDWERLVRVDEKFFRPVDTQELRGDASKARRILGWEPTVPFTEIVARMVQHDLQEIDWKGRIE